MMQIVQAPHPALAAQAKKIAKIDKDVLSLIDEMTKTLLLAKDPEGVGLAAPQVGKSVQLFIVKESPHDPLLIFINPELVVPDGVVLEADETGTDKKNKEVKLEGCLSLQDVWGVVNRYPQIQLTYQDEKGAVHTELFEGFLATIIQHECDHLQGILFPKRVLEQKGQLYKSVKNTKGQMEFEEIGV